MTTFVLMMLIAGISFCIRRQYMNQISVVQGSVCSGQLSSQQDTSMAADTSGALTDNPDGQDPSRSVFMQLYSEGTCVVYASGDSRYISMAHNALWEARRIRIDIDEYKFRQRMRKYAVPEYVIDEYAATIRVMDDTCLHMQK